MEAATEGTTPAPRNGNGAPRVPLTYEDVAQAARDLLADGQQPTNEKVRFALGRGSFSTINNHLRRFRATPEGASAAEGPPERVEKAVHLVWTEMQEASEQKLAEVRLAADEAVAGERALRQAAEQEQARLREVLEQQQAQHQAGLAARQREVEGLRVHLAAETATREGAAAQVLDLQRFLEEARQRTERQEALLVEAAQREAAAAQAAEDLRRRLAGATAEHEETRRETVKLEGLVQARGGELDQLRRELEETGAALQRLTKEQEGARTELLRVTEDCKSAQRDRELAQRDLQRVTGEVEGVRSDLVRVTEARERALQELAHERAGAVEENRAVMAQVAEQLGVVVAILKKSKEPKAPRPPKAGRTR